jgi:hypothetical protein
MKMLVIRSIRWFESCMGTQFAKSVNWLNMLETHNQLQASAQHAEGVDGYGVGSGSPSNQLGVLEVCFPRPQTHFGEIDDV